MRAVILHGPPAAGKDTVTHALSAIDDRYKIFERLKVGSGRTDGYRMSTLQHVEDLRRTSNIIWENRRYGSLYVIDRESLKRDLRDHFPVIHVGQVEAVRALVSSATANWLVVHLWCPRAVAEGRIIERGTGDVDARLRAWDETDPLTEADLSINTAEMQPGDAAALIDRAVRAL